MTKIKYPRLFKNGLTHKLNEEEVADIKSLFTSGMSIAKIAKKFDVSIPAIRYHTNPAIQNRVRMYAKSHYPEYKKAGKNLDKILWRDKRAEKDKEFREYLWKAGVIWSTKFKKKILKEKLTKEEFQIYEDYKNKVAPKIRKLRYLS